MEFYYTGRQTLEDNPYRQTSRPYVIVGALAERRIGPARLFINFENITNDHRRSTTASCYQRAHPTGDGLPMRGLRRRAGSSTEACVSRFSHTLVLP